MAIDVPEQAQQISVQLETLEKILEQEFVALKEQDMDAFDRLQPRKTAIMEMLSAEEVMESIKGSQSLDPSETNLTADISSIKVLTDRCHQLHRRNEILINRKLEAVKGALASLREGPVSDEVEVYTKAGGLTKSKVGNAIKKT